MTIQEASQRYNIPMKILREYESWRLCGATDKVAGNWQYDDTDLERLSLILSLHEIGFKISEIKTYMKLLLEQKNTEKQRMQMLNKKRKTTLDEIHFREKQLDQLDYLRHHIRNEQENNKNLNEKGDA